ncbi:hypothetical protein RD055328_01500 [Companilactobacillus sp. RD055328]|uniref:AlbA family DNA-binding domain-containing protein n=1 Tax=Companilactobacillus sp. RD055328 TaxID=2916634 RepID=UPI001FC807D1|nr:ATP-binding protein [Companilactobacillus sp. RD055328]GKQ42227.1 hypothetical protein RD055328_01500 [Companilactobacillus sp. RD055328]
MNIHQLINLINIPEDEQHDFKQKWYLKNKKDEMIKDIFSFVNTLHSDNCYLIFGVEDLTGKVLGVENDENRMTQQNIIDFINNLSIASMVKPIISLDTFMINSHEVDVVTIYNTYDVPIYLSKKYKNAQPNSIFARNGDTNTSLNSSADYYHVKKLWEKHFRMHESIQERFKYILKDTSNWSEVPYESNYGFVYNLIPDFFVEIVDDEDSKRRNSLHVLSIDQEDVRVDWVLGYLKYRGIILYKMQMIYLDGARFLSTVPNVKSINDKNDKKSFYYYCFVDDYEYLVQQLLKYMNKTPSGEDRYGSFVNSNVIVYKDESEESNIEKIYGEIENMDLIDDTEKESINFRANRDLYDTDKDKILRLINKTVSEKNTVLNIRKIMKDN